jgi:hypothetical protein
MQGVDGSTNVFVKKGDVDIQVLVPCRTERELKL